MDQRIPRVHNVSRRQFIDSSLAATGGIAISNLAFSRSVHAQGSDLLKIALVGCGGRGTGAASQALSVAGNTKLVAMADAFEDRLASSFSQLSARHGERVQVPKDHQFVGFDGYAKAISLADVVILATPPGFRPIQFEEAVKQGKHVFTEKPVAIDAPGVRRFLSAAEQANRKNLKVGIGLQRRHHAAYKETIKRLQDGLIGDIVAMRCYWNGSAPWQHTRESLVQKYGRPLTEMEYQMRNWYYFVWLCGDSIVEQHIHNLDVVNWLKQAHPIRAHGMGGCEVRKGRDYGETFDHHAVEFEFDDGSRCFSQCRHITGCWEQVSEHCVGTKGNSDINSFVIRCDSPWKYNSGEPIDPYQQEQTDFFDAIRNDKAYNEGVEGANSTMTAIMGRMATYSGKVIEWSDAIVSQLDYSPNSLSWDSMPKSLPNADGLYRLPIPGKPLTI